MGENEVKIINNIDTATKLINILYDSDLRFGADFYDLACSGDVREIRRIDNERFAFYTKDNRAEYWMKFKSLLIYMPLVGENFSPILFFEADSDTVADDIKSYVRKNLEKRDVVHGIKFIDEDRIEWNPEEIQDFYSKVEYDEYYIIPEYLIIRHHLSQGIFCFINIQTLSYGRLANVLTKFGNETLKNFEVSLRKAINNKI